MNPGKFKFAKKNLDFWGFEFTEESVEADNNQVNRHNQHTQLVRVDRVSSMGVFRQFPNIHVAGIPPLKFVQ